MVFYFVLLPSQKIEEFSAQPNLDVPLDFPPLSLHLLHHPRIPQDRYHGNMWYRRRFSSLLSPLFDWLDGSGKFQHVPHGHQDFRPGQYSKFYDKGSCFYIRSVQSHLFSFFNLLIQLFKNMYSKWCFFFFYRYDIYFLFYPLIQLL